MKAVVEIPKGFRRVTRGRTREGDWYLSPYRWTWKKVLNDDGNSDLVRSHFCVIRREGEK